LAVAKLGNLAWGSCPDRYGIAVTFLGAETLVALVALVVLVVLIETVADSARLPHRGR
jgi:hypothetical protein